MENMSNVIKIRKIFYELPEEERPYILADLYYRLDDGGKDEFLRETENE